MYTPVSLRFRHTYHKKMVDRRPLPILSGLLFLVFNSLRSTPFFWCVFHFLCGRRYKAARQTRARREGGGREVACVADTLNHLRIQVVETMHGPAATQASGTGSARKKEDCSLRRPLRPLLSRPVKMDTPHPSPPPPPPKKKKKKRLLCLFSNRV